MTGEAMQPGALRAIILGSDLVLAVLPAEPVQLVHACLELGIDIIAPASWGDELIADRVLDELSERPAGTTILCSCPLARRRLLSAGNELTPFLIQSVSPPVATARYLRAMHAGAPLRVTYVGSCPGATDESIDERLSPAEFLELCARSGVVLSNQPRVFESRIPTDRRRFHSMPGGLPAPEAVRAIQSVTDVLALDQNSLSFDLTQCIISNRSALLDPSPAIGCACSGFVGDVAWRDGRESLAALEPPRSLAPVIDARIPVDLETPGQAPSSPAFEEPVPLNVVVGADLSDREIPLNQPGGEQDFRLHLGDDDSLEEPRAQPTGHHSILSQAAADLDLLWSQPSGEEADIGEDMPSRQPGSGEAWPQVVPPMPPSEEQTASRVRRGTPTGTPALQTPSGPLPRAYMMFRRIVSASGEHRVIAPMPSPTPVAAAKHVYDAATGNSHPEDSEEPATSDPRGAPTPANGSRAQTAAPPGRATPTEPAASRGTVETVLDILSKAIRDVVEP